MSIPFSPKVELTKNSLVVIINNYIGNKESSITMKYISFYSDEKFYYCCLENGKITRGINSERFVPDIKYFVSIALTLFIGGIVNSVFKEKMNFYICIIFVVIGFGISFIAGIKYYNHVERKAFSDFKEIFLTKEQLNEYILKGQKQFEIQKIILVFMWLSVVFLFSYFCFSFNWIIWFLGTVMCFISVLVSKWVKPFMKDKFYKNKQGK